MTAIKSQLKSNYLPLISLLGFWLLIQGILHFSTFPNKFDFLLILLLAAISQVIGATPSSEKIQAYEVGSAVGMAAIPIYGPFGAALAGVASGIGIWLTTYNKYKSWKDSIKVLSFNIGMFSISMFLAGWAFTVIQNRLNLHTFPGAVLPWITAAAINDQFNLLLLFGVIRLQQDYPVKFIDFWRGNQWAALINIVVATIGGGLLASAMRLFSWKGIAIFFMPILLSSFAFRLYMRQMQAHMNNLESIIAERTQALQNVMKEKDAYLAVLTHDMKSPLTSIGIYVDMIRKFPHLPQEKPHMIEMVGNSQTTLLNIVNNILDLEKLQVDGNFPLTITQFDLVPTIEAVTEMLRVQASRKSVDLHFEPALLSVNMNGDRQQIERVLQNLISNAIKYTPENGRICIELCIQQTVAVIKVVDTGYGIPETEIPFIFERFRRVPEHAKVAVGTGLGLAITKAIVEAHSGAIIVESHPQVGSTFTVHLPL